MLSTAKTIVPLLSLLCHAFKKKQDNKIKSQDNKLYWKIFLLSSISRARIQTAVFDF
jgi:hypothetical protein